MLRRRSRPGAESQQQAAGLAAAYMSISRSLMRQYALDDVVEVTAVHGKCKLGMGAS